MKQTGVCKYCGQTYLVETDEELTQAEIDYRAMMQCECEEAKRAKIVERSRTSAQDNIEVLFEELPETQEILKRAVDLIAAGGIRAVTVDTGTPVKAKVSMKSNGLIRVDRMETKKFSITS